MWSGSGFGPLPCGKILSAMFFQLILHVPPGLFVCFHFGFGTICADHQMSKTELGNLICMFPQEDREKRPVQVSGLQCAEKKSNADCYIGTVHFLFHSFFVWHIDALTQFILINMNSINMCSQTLTNTLKEQLCEFAKRFHKHVHLKGNTAQTLSVHCYGNVYANSVIYSTLSQN